MWSFVRATYPFWRLVCLVVGLAALVLWTRGCKARDLVGYAQVVRQPATAGGQQLEVRWVTAESGAGGLCVGVEWWRLTGAAAARTQVARQGFVCTEAPPSYPWGLKRGGRSAWWQALGVD